MDADMFLSQNEYNYRRRDRAPRPNPQQPLSLSIFLVAPTLKHRTSVKSFISLQFLNPKKVGRIPCTGDQPVARPLSTQDNTNIHASSGIRIHDSSVRASEDISCLKVRPHYSYSCSCDSLCSRVMWTI
jgi:hypothetical protein